MRINTPYTPAGVHRLCWYMHQIVLANYYPIRSAEYTRCASAKPGNQFWYMRQIVLANYYPIRSAEYTQGPSAKPGNQFWYMHQIVLANYYPIRSAEYTQGPSAKPGNPFWYMHKIVLANYWQIRLAEYTECPLCKSGENISFKYISCLHYNRSSTPNLNSCLLRLRNQSAEWRNWWREKRVNNTCSGAWSRNYGGQIHHRCKRREQYTWSSLIQQ